MIGIPRRVRALPCQRIRRLPTIAAILRYAARLTFARFAAVGAVNTAIDFGVFNVIVLSASDYSAPFVVLANTVSFGVSVPVSYVLNSRFTFRAPLALHALAKYFLVSVGGRVLYNAVLFALVLWLDPADVVKLNAVKLVALVVSLVWNFVGYRYYALRQAGDTQGGGGSSFAKPSSR